MRLSIHRAHTRPLARPEHLPYAAAGPHRSAQRAATAAAQAAGSNSSAPASESIRDFIAREAPLRSIDGSYRERPLAPTLEAPFLVVSELPPPPDADTDRTSAPATPTGLPPCPGAVSLHRLDQSDIDAVLASGGQIILIVAEGDSSGSAPRVAAPRSRRGGGAYCVAGRVAGLLGGTARIVAQQRVAVQALDAGRGLAQAAALPDRWAYMVRSSAVEAAVTGTSDANANAAAAPPAAASAAGAGVSREVATAAAQVADAARDVATVLSESAALAGRLADADESNEAAAREAEAEVSSLLEWACGSSGNSENADNSPLGTTSPSWEQIERLSWAPFAAAALAALSGGPGAVASLSEQRLRALEATDVGVRLEDGLELASRTRAALAAVLALKR